MQRSTCLPHTLLELLGTYIDSIRLSLSLAHTHTLSHFLSHTHTLSLSLLPPLSLSLSLTHSLSVREGGRRLFQASATVHAARTQKYLKNTKYSINALFLFLKCIFEWLINAKNADGRRRERGSVGAHAARTRKNPDSASRRPCEPQSPLLSRSQGAQKSLPLSLSLFLSLPASLPPSLPRVRSSSLLLSLSLSLSLSRKVHAFIFLSLLVMCA
jgi:hypothetical protein